ncbi:MAG: hypothetical protein ABSD41_01830 [Candidatus Bathyarchaeia archaeon]|jgi:hypothetical protein
MTKDEESVDRSEGQGIKDRLELSDYLALCIASLQTIFLPLILVLVLITVLIALIVRFI